MLALNDLRISYGGETVLHDINLSIGEGEKVALIGPSGAGKTTLLKQLYRLQPGQSAFIHQHPSLVSRLSVFHNVYSGRLDSEGMWYNLANLVRPFPGEVEGVRAVLDDLGLSEKLFEKAGALSGGQMQRVAVARALFRGSPILLGDEPVSSIDPKQAEQVLELLRNAAATVVLSLHSVRLALEAFQRIIGLRQGRILFDLPGEEVDQTLLGELFAPC